MDTHSGPGRYFAAFLAFVTVLGSGYAVYRYGVSDGVDAARRETETSGFSVSQTEEANTPASASPQASTEARPTTPTSLPTETPTPLPTAIETPTTPPTPQPEPLNVVAAKGCDHWVFEPRRPAAAELRDDRDCPVWRSRFAGLGDLQQWELTVVEGQRVAIYRTTTWDSEGHETSLVAPDGSEMDVEFGDKGGWDVVVEFPASGTYQLKTTSTRDNYDYSLQFVDVTKPYFADQAEDP